MSRYRPLVPPDMRSHFTRQGDPKRRYTEDSAKQCAVRYNQTAYQCPTCKFWHLASLQPPNAAAHRGRPPRKK